jgi:alpha-1,3-rhamnosyl/mannosyltransferase
VGPGGLADVRARYGIGERYAIYPAIAYPHKNHRVLIDALARPEAPPDLELVLPGGPGPATDSLRRRVDELALGSRVHLTGRIPRSHLDVLLGGALTLAFPSTYEGFGVGVLEGLGLGAPVLAARAAALPEVVEGAGELVAPHDPAEWARALARLAGEDDVARAERVAAGRRRATSFSPARTAEALVAAWRVAGAAGTGGRDTDHRR